MKRERKVVMNEYPAFDEFFHGFLNELGVNFFSSSVLNNSNSVISSYCSNQEWMDFYKKIYKEDPPVKKIILSKRRGIINWDSDLFGNDVKEYSRSNVK